MKNVLTSLSVLAGILSVPVARADCTEVYRQEMNRVRQEMRGRGAGMVDASVGGVVGTGLMAVSSTLIYPPILMTAGAVAVGGTRQGIAAIRLKNLKRVLHLLMESEDGGGEYTLKAVKRLSRRGAKYSVPEVAAEIRDANHADAFCPRDELTHLTKLMSYAAVLKYLRRERD